MVHDMKPDYHLFLRPHAAEGFDTVLYGIHSDRLAGVAAARGLIKENSCAALRAIGVRLGQLSRRSPSGSPGWARPHLQWFRRLPRWGVLARPGDERGPGSG